MEALAAPPAPPARRQVLVGMSLAAVAMAMLTGGMLGVWMLQRSRVLDAGNDWIPSGASVPEVPSNIMLIAFVPVCVCAQWAVWSVKRNDRANGFLALGITALLALMIINAQFFIYYSFGVGLADGTYGTLFFGVTGMFVALMIVGMLVTMVAAFRLFGGRTDDELLAAHAIYWYAVSAVFVAIWFVVYVTK
jgi:heme/copper-type cytochrome/quinol oxidase subunit 3